MAASPSQHHAQHAPAAQPFFYVGHGNAPSPSKSPPPRLKPLKMGRRSANMRSQSPVVATAAAQAGTVPVTSASPVPAPAAERVDAAVAQTWKRLQATVVPSSQHAPATFMSEITAYVESQLQHVARRYPGYTDPPGVGPGAGTGAVVDGNAPSQSGSGMTLLQEEAFRAAGTATLTPEEQARKARLQVFINAQRMFAESFRTYKLFLDALTDEHVAYDRYVEDSITRYKEVIIGLTRELGNERAAHTADVSSLRRQLESERAEFAAEKAKLQRQRQQLIDAARDKGRETDHKRVQAELESQLRLASDQIARLTDENDTLQRQNNQLSIGTFSDALDTANQQLAELRSATAKKDEQLIESHDEAASLARDMKKLVQFHNNHVETPFASTDVRLSNVSLRVLFPEERRGQQQQQQQPSPLAAAVAAHRPTAAASLAAELGASVNASGPLGGGSPTSAAAASSLQDHLPPASSADASAADSSPHQVS